jgi:hypothetical protein
VNVDPLFTIAGVDYTCDVLDDVQVVRGRQHPSESFTPATLQATLVSDAAVNAKRGDVVVFTLNAPASDPTWDTSTTTWDATTGTWDSVAVRVVLFSGRITDLTSAWLVMSDGTTYPEVTILAADPLAELANQIVGNDSTWASETCAARAQRISDLLGYPITTTGTGGVLLARAPQSAPALDLLDAAAAAGSAMGGIYYTPATGVTLWTLGAERNTTTAGLTFDNCDVLAGLKAVKSVTDLANNCTVSYGSPSAEAQASDLGSMDGDGVRTASISTDLANYADALALAQDRVARYAVPAWKLTDVVIPSAVLDTQAGLAEALLNASLGTRVQLSPLPAPAPSTWAGYLEGYTFTMTSPTTYSVTLNLSPQEWTGPLFPWDSAAGTWDAATGVWNDHLTS